MFGIRAGRAGAVGNKTLLAQALSILRRFGTNAHVYLPGIGAVSGLTAGNYLDSNGSTGASPVDGLQGLVLDAAGSVGSELATTNFVLLNGTINQATLPITCTSTASGVYGARITAVLTLGATYLQSITWSGNTSGRIIYADQAGTLNLGTAVSGTATYYYKPNGSTAIQIYASNAAGAGESFTVTSFSCKQVTGIHATSTGAARPRLERGARNLLTYSEGTIAQRGTNIACTNAATSITGFANSIQVPGTPASTPLIYNAYAHTVGVTYTLSLYVQMDDNGVPVVSGTNTSGNDFTLVIFGGVAAGTQTVTAVGNNIYRISTTQVAAGAINNYGVYKQASQSTRGFRVTGYQLELGSTASDYSPTTTAAASNPNAGRYSFDFDGTNDVLSHTPLWQGGDNHAVVVACRFDSTGYRHVCCPAGNAADSKAAPLLYRHGGTEKIGVDWGDGTVTVNISSLAAIPLGTVCILTARKVGTTYTLRVNGVQQGTQTNTLGNTVFDSAALGKGCYNTNSVGGMVGMELPIKGTVTDADLLTLERFVSALTPNGPVF